ncbi:MAG: 5'-methylthioadenosine phosphorylase [Deltaproteobacteria bacterium CG11_big_fil_rev_8_21_14_0_20_45_16]|nr:MAG: 5'-methylthioadenosine phosphorylase [Deltaproteobacteria bacterium CG11_big_fil_rev_8_21_14_0_20_45_16]
MIGILGGTGLYKIEGAEISEELEIETPFGKPSAKLKRVSLQKKDYIFLPRHGENHQYLPHEINYAANIYALKTLGVSQIISISAIGSLNELLKPGDFALIKQYIDATKGFRRQSFFGNGLVGHVSTADPVCSRLSSELFERAIECKMNAHKDTTYVCVEGPRLGTRAESFYFQSMKADVIGMTNVPEAFLAREAQICYASMGVITDFDCWKEENVADTLEILTRYKQSLETVNTFLNTQLSKLQASDCACRHALRTALLTDPSNLQGAQKKVLDILAC